MERQVETIRNLVDSYMRIVRKRFRDYVQMTLMLLMINDVKNFIKKDLPAQQFASGDTVSLITSLAYVRISYKPKAAS